MCKFCTFINSLKWMMILSVVFNKYQIHGWPTFLTVWRTIGSIRRYIFPMVDDDRYWWRMSTVLMSSQFSMSNIQKLLLYILVKGTRFSLFCFYVCFVAFLTYFSRSGVIIIIIIIIIITHDKICPPVVVLLELYIKWLTKQMSF